MLKSVGQLALAGVSLAVLAGCDAPKAPEPAPVVEAAVAAPPPPKTPSELAAAVDKRALCALFNRAASTKDKKVTPLNCVVEPTAANLALSISDGDIKLVGLVAREGETVSLDAGSVSSHAIEDKERGGWTNVGIVFVGQAPAKGLCMTVDTFAPDGKNDSAFIARAGEKEPMVFNAPQGRDAKTAFQEPVIAGGVVSAFAITRREPGLVIRSVTFSACP